MAVTYASIENTLLEQARKEAGAYALKRRREADEQLADYVADLQAAFEKKRDTYYQEYYAQKAEETPKRATASVEAALLRRQARERLADRGLSGSGMEKAALAGAGERQTRLEQASRERVEAMRQQTQKTINAAYAAMLQKRLEKKRALDAAVQKDVRNNQTALEKAARTRASQIARSQAALEAWEA